MLGGLLVPSLGLWLRLLFTLRTLWCCDCPICLCLFHCRSGMGFSQAGRQADKHVSAPQIKRKPWKGFYTYEQDRTEKRGRLNSSWDHLYAAGFEPGKEQGHFPTKGSRCVQARQLFLFCFKRGPSEASLSSRLPSIHPRM